MTTKTNPLSQEVMNTIEKLATKHSSKPFGFYEKEDLYQEVWVICLEKLDTYRPEEGRLENYLSKVVRNQLINLYNARYKSTVLPKKCRDCDEMCKAYCIPYNAYLTNSSRKKDLQMVMDGTNGFNRER